MKETAKLVGTSLGWGLLGLIIIVIVIMAVAIGFFFTRGCPIGDGTLDIKGKVYEWTNAPAGAQSMIFISNTDLSIDNNPGLDYEQIIQQTIKKSIEKIPGNIETAPLEAVVITVKGNKIADKVVTSNSTGDFEGWWITAPGKYEITVETNEDGYMNVAGKTEHTSEYAHIIIAILVRNTD